MLYSYYYDAKNYKNKYIYVGRCFIEKIFILKYYITYYR